MFGVGAGYLQPEFRAIGANYAHRGEVTDEYLDAISPLWDDHQPAYHGRFVDFACVDLPPPLATTGAAGDRRPHAAAYRRAPRGHGWYGYGLTPERAGGVRVRPEGSGRP